MNRFMTYDEYCTESLKILNEARKYLLSDFSKFQAKMKELDDLCESYKRDYQENRKDFQENSQNRTYSVVSGDHCFARGLTFLEAENWISDHSLNVDFDIIVDQLNKEF